ncbi:MAG: energy transducer TonB [Candidatus Cloacimonetes bacterium]|nr:energy transducer TonB [Candidatus Cloacimonadota bacterium]
MEIYGKLRNSDKIRLTAILLSLLLHILFFISFYWLPEIFPRAELPLTPAPPAPQYDRMTFELVDTPPGIADELPTAETELASDQSTKAKDLNLNDSKPDDLPFSEGLAEVKNYPQNYFPENIDEQPQDKTSESESIAENSFLAALKIQQQKLKESAYQEPAFNNIDSSVKDFGGFSFNTYNWDFAPYLLTMQRRIRSNMILPYAFTNLGAISGDILVRFIVSPDGIVNKLEILQSDAHYSLEQSSVNAVQNSSAFDPLPRDFPEDKLIVTAKFSFSILKN